MSQEVGLDGQSGIELMVERAAAGEAGAHEGQALRRLVRRRESELEDNAVELVRCRPVNVAAGSGFSRL